MTSADWGILIPAIVAFLTSLTAILSNHRTSNRVAVAQAKLAEIQAQMIPGKAGNAVPPQR